MSTFHRNRCSFDIPEIDYGFDFKTGYGMSGLQVWHDAHMLSGLVDGGTIASYTDLSGNGNNATQSTEANKPTWQTMEINGRAVARFEGTDDAMDYANLAIIKNCTGASIIAIIKPDSTLGAVYNTIWFTSVGTSTNYRVGLYRTGTSLGVAGRKLDADSFGSSSGAYAGLFVGKYLILSGVLDYTNRTATAYINGISLGTTDCSGLWSATGSVCSNTNSQQCSLGYRGTAFWDGDIAYLLIFNTALSAIQISKINIELGRKFNLGIY